MVEKTITSPRNVIDFTRYQQERGVARTQAICVRLCRHCGAAIAEGENEDECSSAFNLDALIEQRAPRKTRGNFYAD